MKGHVAVEAAKTVIEVADVAWKAMEFTHHHQLTNHENHVEHTRQLSVDEELEALRSENRRLKDQLEQNLKLLQNLSESPCSMNDCPPDLYTRLVATVDSENFLARLKALQQASANKTSIEFPFREATGDDLNSAEILINVSHEEPSWWVWVTEDMVPDNVEERSGIDDENYLVVTEEHVVDGVAYFMAKCILSNPKAQNMTPEELQKSKFADEFCFMKYLNSKSSGKSIGRYEQVGGGVGCLACRAAVLYTCYLGTCALGFVSESSCTETCCKRRPLNKQSRFKGTMRKATPIWMSKTNCEFFKFVIVLCELCRTCLLDLVD